MLAVAVAVVRRVSVGVAERVTEPDRVEEPVWDDVREAVAVDSVLVTTMSNCEIGSRPSVASCTLIACITVVLSEMSAIRDSNMAVKR